MLKGEQPQLGQVCHRLPMVTNTENAAGFLGTVAAVCHRANYTEVAPSATNQRAVTPKVIPKWAG